MSALDPQPKQFASYQELTTQAIDNVNKIPKYRDADGVLFVCVLQTEIKRLQNLQTDKSLTRDPKDKAAVLEREGIEPNPGPCKSADGQKQQEEKIGKTLTRDPRNKKNVLVAEGIEPHPGPLKEKKRPSAKTLEWKTNDQPLGLGLAGLPSSSSLLWRA